MKVSRTIILLYTLFNLRISWLNIDRFDGGTAEVKDEFLGTKCREIMLIYRIIKGFPETKCREKPKCRSPRRQFNFYKPIYAIKYFTFHKIFDFYEKYFESEHKNNIDYCV